MTHWIHPPQRGRDPKRPEFDPIVEGARHGLRPDLSLAIWQRACAEATDAAGRRDDDLARRRFHVLAAQLAARGGQRTPAVGRVTRVGVELDGAPAPDDPLAVRAPGRETLAAIEATRWNRLYAEQPLAGRGTERSEPPGASEVSRATTALQAPPQPAQRAPLDATLRARLGPLFGFDLGGIEVVPESPMANGSTKAVTRDGEVHFRPGSYQPGTQHGDWLFAHDPRDASDKETRAPAHRRRPAPRTSRVGPQLFRKADPEVALPTLLLQDGAASDGERAVEATLRPSGGAPLPAAIRARLEHEFGCDLSGVRLHYDATAAMAARTIAARAFTIGESIFFLRAPDFDSPADFALLAHEVTHVVQHYQGRVEVQRDLAVSTPDHPLEREADAMGAALAQRHRAPPIRAGQVAGPARELMGGAGSSVGPREAHARVANGVARPGALGRPTTLYRSGEQGGAPSGWSKAGDWILGVLAGDFNEDPSTSQIIVRTVLTLIPIVDQVGDVEDLAAAVYKLVWQERYNEFDPWFGLVLSLFGAIPELGSAFKGVIKLVFKGAKENLGKILKFLEPYARQAGELVDKLITKLPQFGKQLAGKMRILLGDLASKTEELIAKLRRIPKIIAAAVAKKLNRLIARLQRFSKAVRVAMQAVEKRVAEAFARIRRQLDHVKESLTLARRIGIANAARLVRAVDATDLAKLVKLDDVALRKLLKLDDGALRNAVKLDDEALRKLVKLDDAALAEGVTKLSKKLESKSAPPKNVASADAKSKNGLLDKDPQPPAKPLTKSQWKKKIDAAEEAGDKVEARRLRRQRYLQDCAEHDKRPQSLAKWEELTDRLDANAAKGARGETHALGELGVPNNNTIATAKNGKIKRFPDPPIEGKPSCRPDGVSEKNWIDTKTSNEKTLYLTEQHRLELAGAQADSGKGLVVVIVTDVPQGKLPVPRPSGPLAGQAKVLATDSMGNWWEWGVQATGEYGWLRSSAGKVKGSI